MQKREQAAGEGKMSKANQQETSPTRMLSVKSTLSKCACIWICVYTYAHIHIYVHIYNIVLRESFFMSLISLWTPLKQSIPGYIPSRIAYVIFFKDAYKNVHRTDTHNSPTLRAIQMPISSRMEKCRLLYSSESD